MSAEAIVNRVAKSGIETLDLGDFYPKNEISVIDIKDWLFQGLILREKDFRQSIEEYDWSRYSEHYVGIFCSADAIVPVWAYMLITTKLGNFTRHIYYGDIQTLLSLHYKEALQAIDPFSFKDKRVVIKGCGDKEVPAEAFVEAIRLLQPYAKSIMYGEPCSTVPVYKQSK